MDKQHVRRPKQRTLGAQDTEECSLVEEWLEMVIDRPYPLGSFL
jgi:hypothetical protein